MAISKQFIAINEIRTVPNLTSGNEVIFGFNPDTVVTVEAFPTAAGVAQTYTSLQTTEPSDFTEMVKVAVEGDEAFQDSNSVKGQSWVGVKVDSGTWTVTISSQQEG